MEEKKVLKSTKRAYRQGLKRRCFWIRADQAAWLKAAGNQSQQVRTALDAEIARQK